MGKEESQSKVLKAGVGYTIGNYFIKGIGFLSLPLFSRLLTTADYGQYNTYMAYENVIFVLIGLALHSSLKSAKYKYKEGFEKYISNCLILIILNLVIWITGVNILYDLFAGTIGFSRYIINILLLHSFGMAVFQYYNIYVGLSYQYKAFIKLSFMNAVLNIGVSIVLILTVFKGNPYAGRIIGNAFPVILFAVLIVLWFFKKNKPDFNKEHWKYGITYSMPIIPHGISQILLTHFDRIMINYMVGSAAAGIYSFSYNIFSIIQVTSASLDNVWGAWFYEKIDKKEYGEIRKQGGRYAFGMLAFSSIMLLVSPEIIKIMGSKDYWDAVYTVIPVVTGGYFTFLYTLPAYIEYYYEKTKFIAIGTCASAVLNVILNYIFINRYGYVAAAYTTLFTYLIYFLFHYFMARKIHGSFLYSNKQIFSCVGIILVINMISLYLIKLYLLRWLIAGGIIIFTLIWLNKVLDLYQKLSKLVMKIWNKVKF